VPVQLTWICGLSEEYYKLHFAQLFQQTMIPSISQSERKTLSRQVVDFLLAQKEGFVNAYMEVFSETDRQIAMSKLKGCHEHFCAEHFCAQITRIKMHRAIIPSHKEVVAFVQNSQLIRI
jgi:hypothetical protein